MHNSRYDVIIKMETFARDSQYLKQKLGLDIEVNYVRKGGRKGHINQDRFESVYFIPFDSLSFRTLDIFKTVDINIRRRLYDIYKYDFELFGYDWSKYFKS